MNTEYPQQQLSESEIEMGMALSAVIQATQNNLIALAMAEQMYIEQLRTARGLDALWTLTDWARGFEHGK